MPSQSLTDEIMGLVGDYSDGPCVAAWEAIRSRLQSLESELTELREKAQTNEIRTSLQAEAIRSQPSSTMTIVTDPTMPRNQTKATVDGKLFAAWEFGSEDGG